jgi:hypothetical protein
MFCTGTKMRALGGPTQCNAEFFRRMADFAAKSQDVRLYIIVSSPYISLGSNPLPEKMKCSKRLKRGCSEFHMQESKLLDIQKVN